MRKEAFINQINKGKSVACIYDDGDLVGIIAVWIYEGEYILTWEECPPGCQLDESTFTKDIRETFSTIEELFEYLSNHKLSHEDFRP
jgi:hypothetical protein